MDDGEDGLGDRTDVRDTHTRDPDAPSVASALLAGAALYNEGHVLAAHDPWEAAWLPLDSGTDRSIDEPLNEPFDEPLDESLDESLGDAEATDERLLHGLIAFVAATHHARSRNWTGATGCAENAVEHLAGLTDRPRGVDLAPVRAWCRRLAADPETVERASPPSLRIGDAVPGFDALDLRAVSLAAPALAEAVDGEAVDVGAVDVRTAPVFERAVALAREERGTGKTTFTELLFAFCREPETRPQVAARLADHVELADRKRRDVADLF
ncbi:DUF309 domain-containing protein [Halorubrum sp. DTA46]|uniref:DUF309 domain-containing protein n=1 Tax=Halorubrum sp. DTA46 TaxID=3402162 RepID=UPI003AB0461E